MAELLTTREWKDLRGEVLQRDNYTCAYCGTKDGILCADHIIPFAQYGADKVNNLTTACRSCNSRKGSRTPEQWKKGERPYLNSPRKNPWRRFRAEKASISCEEFDKVQLRLKTIGLSFKQLCLDAGISAVTVKCWESQRRHNTALTGSTKNYNLLIKAFNRLAKE